MKTRVLLCVAVCAFLLIEMASGSCMNASQAFTSAGMCYPELTLFGNRDYCNTSSPTQCRMLVDDVLNFCNSSDFLYNEAVTNLNLICNALPGCFNATREISGDYFCDLARQNLTYASPGLVCNGTCRGLLDNLVTECGNNATGAGVQADLNIVCPLPISNTSSSTSFMASTSNFMAPPSTSILMIPSVSTSEVSSSEVATTTSSYDDHLHPTPSVDPCHNAVSAFNNNTDCTAALNATDIATICRGPCRLLVNSIAANCGDDGPFTAADITERCTGGAEALRMGVLAILMVVLMTAMTV